MSHVHDLRRAEALGIISSREYDRLIDDAIEMDAIEDRRERLAYERMESEYYRKLEEEHEAEMKSNSDEN